MRYLLRLLDWLFMKPRDVSPAWLRDHERRASTRGVEQSASRWPWKGWE